MKEIDTEKIVQISKRISEVDKTLWDIDYILDDIKKFSEPIRVIIGWKQGNKLEIPKKIVLEILKQERKRNEDLKVSLISDLLDFAKK